jgi:nicotinamide-nucleotide amidase
MPSVEIVAVGTELLLGQLTDTNTAYIAAALAGHGINVFATHMVGDNRERIAGTFRLALERADGVVSTGGLGPTVDDLTKEALCDVFGCTTELNAPALRKMEETFARLGRAMRENNRKQADIPKGATVLQNEYGTAPGFVAVRGDGKFVACMPGVPSEMKPMLGEGLLPWLRERYDLRERIHTRVLHTVQIAESEIDHRIADLFRSLENPKIAVLAHDYGTDVKIMARAESGEEARALIAPVEHEVVRRLSGHVFGVDDQTLPGAIHALLERMKKTVAAAESCTGGAVCAALTSTPGSSKHFNGGVVAYGNAVKQALLSVSRETIARHGAVSQQTAVEMAEGARRALNADIALSTTGIAGPDGGSCEKPVGLVFIALAGERSSRAVRLELGGGRAAIQSRAATNALALLWKALAREEPF